MKVLIVSSDPQVCRDATFAKDQICEVEAIFQVTEARQVLRYFMAHLVDIVFFAIEENPREQISLASKLRRIADRDERETEFIFFLKPFREEELRWEVEKVIAGRTQYNKV